MGEEGREKRRQGANGEMHAPACRHCGEPLRDVFIDLGHQPPSNAYLTAADLHRPEITLPLRAFVCGACRLVQVPAVAAAEELFTPDYAYFSSVSRSWLEHARRYVEEIVERLELDGGSLVVEVASNDGYLLQFVREKGIPCYGVEPTRAAASVARRRGVETLELFFGEQVARDLRAKRGAADLMVANNVLAHVPDINDFVAGFAALLAPEGVATFEFQHLLRLVEQAQFDTIYHEHYSYLSLHVVERILDLAGLRVFDVRRLSTHGGSLRVFACHREAGRWPRQATVDEVLREEREAGVLEDDFYTRLQERAQEIKNDLLAFLLEQKRAGRMVMAYGAAAKGNTLLNYAGVRPDLLPAVFDAAPSKQGRYLPGSHVPVLPPEELGRLRPDWILVLPWNIRDEIMESLAWTREWGARFVIAVPELETFAD